MKKIIIILTLIFVTSASYGQFIKEDKLKHIFAGSAITGITNFTVVALSKNKRSKATLRNAKIIGFGVGLLAGHLREKQGKKNGGRYDVDDLLNTALGSFVVTFSLDKLYKSNKKAIFE